MNEWSKVNAAAVDVLKRVTITGRKLREILLDLLIEDLSEPMASVNETELKLNFERSCEPG
jgi:hypothetical protein